TEQDTSVAQQATKKPFSGSNNNSQANPNVVVSGWQVYDNKGRVVEKYEPFFGLGWKFQREEDAKQGQHASMFYDPRGQVIHTQNPDSSEQSVIYGVPSDLDDPLIFTPTPWEAYTYDANDNAGRTHPVASRGYLHHYNTPSSILIDALGRTLMSVERNRTKPATAADPLSAIEEIRIRSAYDIQGNLLKVTDAMDREASTHVHDLAKRPLKIHSIDAGEHWMVQDTAGNAIEGRDSKGALVLHAYDVVNRPTHLWARDGTGQALTLRGR